jgi:hypothetical protein
VQNITKLVILFICFITLGCKKKAPIPAPPVITFIDANVAANKASAVVKIEFLDEDGDLGLTQEENEGQQQYNVFVDYYEKINGVWVLKSPLIIWNPDISLPLGGTFDTSITNLRLPFLENEAQRALQGEVSLDLIFYNTQNFAFTPGPDTVKYGIYIQDRAFQKSNVITTTALIID